MDRAPDLDSFFADETWGAVLSALRAVLAGTELGETLKWGAACYVYDGSNVAILGGYSDGCRLAFFKGALIEDPAPATFADGAAVMAVLDAIRRSSRERRWVTVE